MVQWKKGAYRERFQSVYFDFEAKAFSSAMIVANSQKCMLLIDHADEELAFTIRKCNRTNTQSPRRWRETTGVRKLMKETAPARGEPEPS